MLKKVKLRWHSAASFKNPVRIILEVMPTRSDRIVRTQNQPKPLLTLLRICTIALELAWERKKEVCFLFPFPLSESYGCIAYTPRN